MVSGVIFLSAIVGMVLVVAWVLKNDNLGPSGKTTGFLAMKEAEKPEQTPEKRPPYAG